MNSEQFRRSGYAAIDKIADYIDNIDKFPAYPRVERGYLRDALPDLPPDQGQPWSDIEKDIHDLVIPGLIHYNSPRNMAFWPISGSFPSILGELYSAAFNQNVVQWSNAPAIVELEIVVLDWLCKSLALPSCFLSSTIGGGVFLGGASEAMAACMVAARERYVKQICDDPASDGLSRTDGILGRLVSLASDQSHSCVEKSAIVAGVQYRPVATSLYDTNPLGMTGDNLLGSLRQCREEGLEPFFVTVTLGTTSTCAIDEVEKIAEIARSKEWENIWFHVDAAYLGSALLCPEYQYLAKDLSAFDSFNFNIHKLIPVNIEASCLYLRNARHLTEELSVTPAYLKYRLLDQATCKDTEPRDWSLLLSRRARGLKVWTVLRTYGIDALQNHIRHVVKLGEHFESLLRERPDLFTVFTPAILGLTVFTVNPEPRGRQPNGGPNSMLTGNGTVRSHHPERSAQVQNRSEAQEEDKHQCLLGSQQNGKSKSNSKHERTHSTVAPVSEVFKVASAPYREASNQLTNEVANLVNHRGEIFLTSSEAMGWAIIRIVSGSFKSDEVFVEKAFQVLVKVAEELKGRRVVGM